MEKSRMELAVLIKGLGRGNAFLAYDCHMKNINKMLVSLQPSKSSEM